MLLKNPFPTASQPLQRRSFLTRAGMVGLGATAAAFVPAATLRAANSSLDNLSGDTPQEIFTAALIAEDLACTFYYNVLNGPVITDPNLAGPGGTATNVTSGGNLGNVDYLLAALNEEIAHANLLRSLIGGSGPATDPYQFFYLPFGAFEDLATFATVLNALESAFIGAYLNATIEFAQMAADTAAGRATYKDFKGNPYTSRELEYFSQVSASIMGIESEHRVLGRVISNTNPANNLNYEQTDGLTSVYNGKNSAVAALTPFLSPGSGLRSLDFVDALRDAAQKNFLLATTGSIPPPPAYPAS
jgi:hypothetical protein